MRGNSQSNRKRGPRPAPRLHVNPALRQSVHDSGRPLWRLAQEVGLTHAATFSALINKADVPGTRINIERLHKIASIVGFDVSEVFV